MDYWRKEIDNVGWQMDKKLSTDASVKQQCERATLAYCVQVTDEGLQACTIATAVQFTV